MCMDNPSTLLLQLCKTLKKVYDNTRQIVKNFYLYLMSGEW